ncbi:MAG: TatD family hydrolase, partial [Chloroflexota bacterium]|nr:TatD family hydrolase [Chloroflexota bacterium]
MLRVIDSHAHLESVADLGVALKEAVEAGLAAVVAVGSDYRSNQEVLELAQRWKPWVHPALGLHPSELGSAEVDQVLHFIEDHISQAVGIGEIGLDYDRRVKAAAGTDRQQAVFRELLGLARKHRKPALIHSRYAWKDAFDLTREAGVERAVFHWYTGLSSVLREIIAQGYLISATPAAEYHAEHRRAIKEAPLDRLLLETDGPVAYGRDNRYPSRPADVVRSLRAVAQLKGVAEDVVAE